MIRWRALAACVVAAASLVAVSPAHADPANMIANPGFESGATSWTPDSWGTNNAQLSLVPTAHGGTSAAQTTITSYFDGDAKWIPDPVAVTPGATYDYTDWYQADVTTHVWARLVMSDATVQYQFLGTAAPSTTWSTETAAITVPSGVAAASVMHVLASAGHLLIDDAALEPASPACVPASVGGLPNGDFEDPCPATAGVPAGWTADAANPGTVTYTVTSTAAHGTSAAQIDNSLAGSEAGITAAIASPQPGQGYALNFAQLGNTYVYAYATIGLADGTTTYQSLMSAPATQGSWSRYTDDFLTPASTRSLSITLATSGAGEVILDDVSLTALPAQSPATFRAPMVSLSFDDGDASAYANAWPTMKYYGYRGTFYLNAAALNTTSFLTSTQVRTLASAGNEIGSHLYHHSDMVQLDDATLRSELSGNIAALRRIVGASAAVSAFASPFGSYTSSTVDTVMQYEASHRTTDGALNTKTNLNARQIHAVLVTPSMTSTNFAALLQRVQAAHAWLVLVYHEVAASDPTPASGEGGFTVTPAAFKAQLAALHRAGIAVTPVSSALTSLQAQ